MKPLSLSSVLGSVILLMLLSCTLSGLAQNNYLPKYATPTTYTPSQVFDDGTNVGIGTIVPSFLLDVQGSYQSENGDYFLINHDNLLGQGYSASGAYASYPNGIVGNFVADASFFGFGSAGGGSFQGYVDMNSGLQAMQLTGYNDNGTSIDLTNQILSFDPGGFHYGSIAVNLGDVNISAGIGFNSYAQTQLTTAGGVVLKHYTSGGTFETSVSATNGMLAKGFNNVVSTQSFGVQNQSGTNLFTVRNNGSIGINSTSPDPNAKLDVYGRTKTQQLQVAGGSPVVGYVLTASNANGEATWQALPTTSLPTGTVNQTLRHNGTTWVSSSALLNHGSNVSVSGKLYVGGQNITLEYNQTTPPVGPTNHITNLFTGIGNMTIQKSNYKAIIGSKAAIVGGGSLASNSKLDVNGPMNLLAYDYTGGVLVPNEGKYLQIDYANANNYASIQPYNNNGTTYEDMALCNQGGVVRVGNKRAVVGGGSTASTGKLDVNGPMNLLAYHYTGGVLVPNEGKYLQIEYGNANNYASIQPYTNYGTAYQNLALCKNGGAVRIGNATVTSGSHTDYKLSVDGKVVAKSYIATITSWADYVFYNDYKLMPLSDVADFITENGHLPEIPSEKMVMENGVDMADMQVLLLKKVEELTLYVIELERQNQLMQEKLTKIEQNR